MKNILILLCLSFAFIGSGCTTVDDPTMFTRNIKADEVNITHSTPWTTLNINAKAWDSSVEALKEDEQEINSGSDTKSEEP